MNSDPNDLAFSTAGGRGASAPASCWSCSERLAVDDRFCPCCGANIEGAWIQCEISCWRGWVYGEFTAVYRGEAPWSIAARSERFRWVRGEEPPRTPAVEARFAELCQMLEADGWRREGRSEPDPWYRLSFHSFVGPPGPGIELKPPHEPESVLALAPIPEEYFGKLAAVVAEDEPVAVVAEALPPEPLEVAPTKHPKHPPASAPEPVSDQVEPSDPESPEAEESHDDPGAVTEPGAVTAVEGATRTPRAVDAAASEELEGAVAPDPGQPPAPAQPEPSEGVDPAPWHVTPLDAPVLTLSAIEELRRQSELLSRIGAYTIK